MEENNLDDFFAKKDKTKKKSKSYSSQKFTVDDILQAKKENEEKSKKGKSSKKGTKESANSAGALGPKLEGDEEWVEIEEETEKDYSGLRIQNIQISGKSDDDRQDGSSQRADGEDGEGKDSAQGPWKQLPATAVTTVVIPLQKKPEPSAVESSTDTPKPSSGKYVPPQMRRSQAETPAATAAAASTGSSRLGSRAKKNAPNVDSQEDFPTLGSAVDASESSGFEKIRSGARQCDDPTSQQVKLSLGNKFDALDADDS